MKAKYNYGVSLDVSLELQDFPSTRLLRAGQ